MARPTTEAKARTVFIGARYQLKDSKQ